MQTSAGTTPDLCALGDETRQRKSEGAQHSLRLVLGKWLPRHQLGWIKYLSVV